MEATVVCPSTPATRSGPYIPVNELSSSYFRSSSHWPNLIGASLARMFRQCYPKVLLDESRMSLGMAGRSASVASVTWRKPGVPV
jgi:hypothetical protein